MKKSTIQKHTKLANDVMFYIYTHLDSIVDTEDISKIFSVDKYYLHKVFKEVFGENIYATIRSIRLQKAANLLVTNPHTTLSEIALMCGYTSHSSFIKAFSQRFGMTPKAWRNGGFKEYAKNIAQVHYNTALAKKFEKLEPKILKMPSIDAYYIRHRGITPSIKYTWQKILAWIYSNDINNYRLIALLHDNPSITPLQECRYVACVEVLENKNVSDTLPKFQISKGLYAQFSLQCTNEELWQFFQWFYQEWLPRSGYETTIKPSYIIYENSNYIDNNQEARVQIYLSVTL